MTYPNWKDIAAGHIKCPDVPAPVTTSSPDSALAANLKDAIDNNIVSGAANLDFARSLLAGYEKYGSFTDRQRPHVERLIIPSPDKPLAQALEVALASPVLTSGEIEFGSSLLAGFYRFGSFTERQRPHAVRLAEKGRESASNVAGKAPSEAQVTTSPETATPVALPPPVAPETFLNLCDTVSLTKFSRFTVGQLALTLKNDGSVIWVKWMGKLAGLIDTQYGTYRQTRKYLSEIGLKEALNTLREIEKDPLGAAKVNGMLTGRCSCCGRALTDPVSIAFGIGPVCRSRGWGLML